jgi:hypothetical protein
MEQHKATEGEGQVYYFRCEGCKSEIFWSDIKPVVERAARVFKWVRAGCPHPDCSCYLILSSPDKVLSREDAVKIYEEKKSRGEANLYWV